MKGKVRVQALIMLLVGVTLSCKGPRPIRYSPGIRLGGTMQINLDYETYTMRNGLTVVLAPDQESNLVTVDMRYFVGAADEDPAQNGVAHLVEHLLFEVQPTGEETLASKLAGVALTYNARTTLDSTHYNSVALAPNLEALLEIEALRMEASCDQLSQELFDRELAVVMQETAQRGQTSDVMKTLTRTIWGDQHPFGRGVSSAATAALTKADACAFVQRHYHPAQAALIIGGAIQTKPTLALIAKHFNRMEAKEPAARPTLPAMPAAAAREVSLAVERPAVMVVFPMAPVGSPRRVVENLTVQMAANQVASSVRKHAMMKRGAFGLVGSARQEAVAMVVEMDSAAHYDKTVEEIFKAVDRAFELPSEAEIEGLQASAVTELMAEHDDMLGRGWLIAEYCQFSMRTDYHGHDIEEILKITPKSLTEIGKSMFKRERARVFRVAKAPNAKAVIELALSGDRREYELPPGARQLGTIDPALLATAPRGAPRTVDYRLANGLRVILVPRHEYAFFEARMMFPIGDADDPKGLSGTAEAAATLLKMRTWGLSIGDVLAMLSTAFSGGVMSAATTEHTTLFGVHGAPSLASMHLWRLHVLLENGEYDERTLNALKKRKSEPSDDTDDPDEASQVRLRRAVWERMLGPGHRFLRAYDSDTAKVSIEDLERFRNSNYQANGAALVVVGGFDLPTIKRDIEVLWGAWPARPPLPAPAPLLAKPGAGPSYFALERPDRQLLLRIVFAARSDARRDSGVRLVAQKLLEARMREVRERLGATYGLSVFYRELGNTSFVNIVGKVAVDRGGEVLQQVLGRLDLRDGDAGQLALDVAHARRKAVEEALARTSSSSQTADAIMSAVIAGRPIEDAAQLPAIGAVTTRQVRELLEADLDPTRMIIAASGPGAKAALEASGAAKIEVIR